MKKMQELELGHAPWDSKYVMMSPSPVHLQEYFPGQLAVAEGKHIDFQPSVDESQLPDPIIPSQEMLHNVLYSRSAVGAGIDVGSFDPLLCRSSEMGAGQDGSGHVLRPLPRQRTGHHGAFPDGGFDSNSGPTGILMGQEWDPLPTQPFRRTSQDSGAPSSSSSERSLGHPQGPSAQHQLFSPPTTSGNAAEKSLTEQFQALCKEFPDLNAMTCETSLTKHGGNLELAREEVKVRQLMGMSFPYIDEDDCRRALSHCQGKMERAAMWLMEQSETIASRT